MKTVILAGGLGTRISEETALRPKPMIEIGGKPILWHIMKIYSFYGINEFIICCGYKGYMIKEYFSNYFLHNSDVSFNMKENTMHVHEKHVEPWQVTLVDTGEATNTGGRLKRLFNYLKDEPYFCFTYGDGLADIDIEAELSFHQSQNRLVTMAAVQPPGRFGAISTVGVQVDRFVEKPDGDSGRVNGGFFVASPRCLDYIEGDETSWEYDTLPKIAHDQQLVAYNHDGFWQPMDTLREKNKLENLWQSGRAPWKLWT